MRYVVCDIFLSDLHKMLLISYAQNWTNFLTFMRSFFSFMPNLFLARMVQLTSNYHDWVVVYVACHSMTLLLSFNLFWWLLFGRKKNVQNFFQFSNMAATSEVCIVCTKSCDQCGRSQYWRWAGLKTIAFSRPITN